MGGECCCWGLGEGLKGVGGGNNMSNSRVNAEPGEGKNEDVTEVNRESSDITNPFQILYLVHDSLLLTVSFSSTYVPEVKPSEVKVKRR